MNLHVASLPLVFSVSEGSCRISLMRRGSHSEPCIKHLTGCRWASRSSLFFFCLFSIYVQCILTCTYSVAFRWIDMVSFMKALRSSQRASGTEYFSDILKRSQQELAHWYISMFWHWYGANVTINLLFYSFYCATVCISWPVFSIGELLFNYISLWVSNCHTSIKPPVCITGLESSRFLLFSISFRLHGGVSSTSTQRTAGLD